MAEAVQVLGTRTEILVSPGRPARKQAQCDIGCRQPKIKDRISAAATEGANGMRFLSPPSAQPNLAATTCAAEKIARRACLHSGVRRSEPSTKTPRKTKGSTCRAPATIKSSQLIRRAGR